MKTLEGLGINHRRYNPIGVRLQGSTEDDSLLKKQPSLEYTMPNSTGGKLGHIIVYRTTFFSNQKSNDLHLGN